MPLIYLISETTRERKKSSFRITSRFGIEDLRAAISPSGRRQGETSLFRWKYSSGFSSFLRHLYWINTRLGHNGWEERRKTLIESTCYRCLVHHLTNKHFSLSVERRFRAGPSQGTAVLGIVIGKISLQIMKAGFVWFLFCNVALVVARQCAYPSSNHSPSTTTRWSIDISNRPRLRVESHGSILYWHRLPNWKRFFPIVFVISFLWHLVENTKQMSQVHCWRAIREPFELSYSFRSAVLTFDVATDHMTISMILPLCSDLNVSLDGDGYVHLAIFEWFKFIFLSINMRLLII